MKTREQRLLGGVWLCAVPVATQEDLASVPWESASMGGVCIVVRAVANPPWLCGAFMQDFD